MVQDGAGGGGDVAHLAVAEVTDEHFVDGGNEHFPKVLVGLVVLVEGGGGDVMGVEKVCDLGARHNRWDGWLGAGVYRGDEGRGRECCIHSGGDGELQQSKCSAAQV